MKKRIICILMICVLTATLAACKTTQDATETLSSSAHEGDYDSMAYMEDSGSAQLNGEAEESSSSAVEEEAPVETPDPKILLSDATYIQEVLPIGDSFDNPGGIDDWISGCGIEVADHTYHYTPYRITGYSLDNISMMMPLYTAVNPDAVIPSDEELDREYALVYYEVYVPHDYPFGDDGTLGQLVIPLAIVRGAGEEVDGIAQIDLVLDKSELTNQYGVGDTIYGLALIHVPNKTLPFYIISPSADENGNAYTGYTYMDGMPYGPDYNSEAYIQQFESGLGLDE